MAFKELFETYTNFNPFTKVTITSAYNLDLRMNIMKPKTIASEPLHGWRLSPNQSKAAFGRLEWEERQEERDTYDLMPGPNHPLHQPRI